MRRGGKVNAFPPQVKSGLPLCWLTVDLGLPQPQVNCLLPVLHPLLPSPGLQCFYHDSWLAGSLGRKLTQLFEQFGNIFVLAHAHSSDKMARSFSPSQKWKYLQVTNMGTVTLSQSRNAISCVISEEQPLPYCGIRKQSPCIFSYYILLNINVTAVSLMH